MRNNLRGIVRNNTSIPPGLPSDTTVFRIDGIKITDLLGKIIGNKTSQKRIISFLYDRQLLQSNAFDIG